MRVNIGTYDGTRKETFLEIDYILFEYQEKNANSYWLKLYPKNPKDYNLGIYNSFAVEITPTEEYFIIQ